MSMDRRSSSQTRLLSSGNSVAGASFKKTRSLTGGSTSRPFMEDEESQTEEVVLKIVKKYDKRKWKKIAEYLKDRKCKCRQFLNLDAATTVSWTEEEDDKLVESVIKYGTKNWSAVAQNLPGKNGKQCRDRWHEHFDYNFEAWTREEDIVLIHYQQIHGNKWTQLTKYLPGRTKEAINLYWHSCLKNKVDSYINSSLLAQFKSLPPVAENNPDQPVLSSSIRIEQGSGAGRTIWKYFNKQQGNSHHIDNLRVDMIGNNKNCDLLLKPPSDEISNLTRPNNFIGPVVCRGTGKRLEGMSGGGYLMGRMSSTGRMQVPPVCSYASASHGGGGGYMGGSSTFPNHRQELQPNSQCFQQLVEERNTTTVHRRRYSTSALPNNNNNNTVGASSASAFHHRQLVSLQHHLVRAGPSNHTNPPALENRQAGPEGSSAYHKLLESVYKSGAGS